jgi:hypothetical protein
MDMMTEGLIEAQSEPEDVGQWLASCAHDPVKFVMEAFRWGEGELKNSTGPEPWQLWVLEQIRDGLLTPSEAIRVACASGHGVGKSACASWATLWSLMTLPDTRGIVTASSQAMLETRYRAELKTWHRRCRGAEWFELTQTSLLSRDPEHSQVWRIDMIPWSESRSETLAGLHNKGRRIVVIFDEASAIAPIVWDTVQAATTDADAEVIWLVFGNPLHPVGRFREIWTKYQHRWRTRNIDSRTISFTNKRELARWIEDYGEDSDFVRTRIKGEFPRVGSSMFISPEAVDRAMSRELVPSHNDPLVAGVDVARYGSDASVCFFRKGHDCRSIPPAIFRGLSIAELEDRVVWLHNQYQPVQWMIDGGGVGGGLIDHLRRRNLLVVDVQFGSRADQGIDGVKYANKRAEMYGLLRQALDYLALPVNAELKEQLTCFEYAFNQRGEILLESKDSLRRRGVSSPDISDALATTYACETALLPALSEWAQPRGAVSEYDPFSEDALLGRQLPEAQPKYYVPGWARMRNETNEGWDRQDWEDAQASDALRGAREDADHW